MSSARARGREAMSNEPRIEARTEQPYAGIRATTAPDGIPAVVDRGFPELFGYLAERGIAPLAAPFIRYHSSGEELDLELGVPVAAPVEAAGRIAPGTLPAGRWATLLHVGPFSGLGASWDVLDDWVDAQGAGIDASTRVEQYLVDPSAEPDSGKWETELACLLTSRAACA